MSTIGPHFEYKVTRSDGKPVSPKEEAIISGIIQRNLYRGICASLVVDGEYRFNTLWSYNREKSPEIQELKRALRRRGYILDLVGGGEI